MAQSRGKNSDQEQNYSTSASQSPRSAVNQDSNSQDSIAPELKELQVSFNQVDQDTQDPSIIPAPEMDQLIDFIIEMPSFK